MRIFVMLSALMVSLALVGCAPAVEIKRSTGKPIPEDLLRALGTQPACRPIFCQIDIEVVGECKFRANPMVLVFYGGPANATERAAILEIKDANYKFAENAFDPKGSTAFFGTPTAVGPRGLNVPVRIANQGDTHEYGLKILKKDGTACAPYDPWMVE